MLTPLPVAEALLVAAAGLLTMALVAGVFVFVIHALLAVVLAGQLVGKAVKG